MHFHYFTLRHLSHYLNEFHQGEIVGDCFSQNRNELVVEMDKVFLRIGCHTPQTYIVPSEEFSRSRKNVVELFPEIKGLSFTGSRVVPWERVLILELENQYDLVLKMFGSSSNVLLRHEGQVIRLFNNQKEEDFDYTETPGTFDETAIKQDVPADEELVLLALRRISPVMEKQFARKTTQLIKSGISFEKAYYQIVADSEKEKFAIRKLQKGIKFSLLPAADAGDVIVRGISDALQLFLRAQFQFSSYRSRYNEVEKELRKPVEKYKKVYSSYQTNIRQLEEDRNPEEIGHILMANLHAIPPHVKEVELEDFYQGGTLKIKLDPTFSAQENAHKYYQKHKQRKGKLTYLKGELEDIEGKYLAAEEALEAFLKVPSPEALSFTEKGFDYEELKLLKQFSKEKADEEGNNEKKYPFRTYFRDGFEIFVGKDGKNNDELSFKFASRDDLWLHARDVPGSHVIIRQRAGKPIPPSVLEYAAQLAAFYSKRKNDSLVPVQYTTRKYIRKRKGDPPGMVAVDREEVIMVEPVRG